jgi:DNA-directed RNA polymerase specialized sigma24 family protein
MFMSSSVSRGARLADPGLRRSLSDFVRTRVPPDDVEDIVQATLAEALAAERAPEQDDEVAAWVHGIARHKVVDWYRRGRRELPQDPGLADGVAGAESAPQSARDLLRWAERELPEGPGHERTLEWMLREGEGEKLEAIAADEQVPAPRVRQRVVRLRKHYRARWAAQAAVIAAILAVAAFLYLRKKPVEKIAPLPEPLPWPSAPVAPVPTAPEPLPEQRPAEGRKDASAPVPAPSSSVAPRRTAPAPVSTESAPPPSMRGSSGP